MATGKPHLSLPRILQMNLGFLGLQFSFGLQQANPIFAYLGADEKDFPWLGIAGPLTGLIVQPLIGVMSDRTLSPLGRRTPYFLIGALMCSAGLFLMPFSQSLLMAFSILFLLDVGNNITMEPYRAYVNDRLREEQRGFGFLSQSGFTGLAQCLAYASPFLLVSLLGVSKVAEPGVIPDYTRFAFHIGAVLSLTTILWSIWRVPELPLTELERKRIAALPRGFASTFTEIFAAMREMPQAMRTMAWMSLFQWYAMCCYWAYRVPSISMALFGTSDGSTAQFREADLLSGPMGAFYNAIAFVAAFSMAPLARRFGAVRLHAICLVFTGFAMIAMPMMNSEPPMWILMGIMGLGWGSIMGNPYIILANAIPAERTGVYMGIFNMMICAPMLVFAGTMTFIYEPVLGGDPRNALAFGGVLMLCAAVAVLRIKGGGEPAPRTLAVA
ncbi:MAG: MFS transporter [Novosphingobium sp.]|nr:MFS transporter [Novosphingobium sp.]